MHICIYGFLAKRLRNPRTGKSLKGCMERSSFQIGRSVQSHIRHRSQMRPKRDAWFGTLLSSGFVLWSRGLSTKTGQNRVYPWQCKQRGHELMIWYHMHIKLFIDMQAFMAFIWSTWIMVLSFEAFVSCKISWLQDMPVLSSRQSQTLPLPTAPSTPFRWADKGTGINMTWPYMTAVEVIYIEHSLFPSYVQTGSPFEKPWAFNFPGM